VGLTIDKYHEAQSDEEIEDEEYQREYDLWHDHGRNHCTGY